MIRQHWDRLDPKKKRFAVIGATVLGLVVVMSFFSGGEPTKKTKDRQETVRHVLTDRNTREVGIDAMSADLRKLSKDLDALRKENERIQAELDRTKGSLGTENVGRRLQHLEETIGTLKQNNRDLSDQVRRARAPQTGKPVEEQVDEKVLDVFRDAKLPDSKGVGNVPDGRGPAAAGGGMKIVMFSEKKEEPATPVDPDEGAIYIPAGSILTGVLINGMDAPTSQGARRDPVPSTMRIQKEAILPNRFRADIRECFLIVSGHGDLSSERAFLRGEVLSCIREDGGVIETRLDSYVVGEDGKTGIRGRLVSKQGQIIAKSLMAGFLSGVSEAFDVNPVPVINTSPGSSTQYQSVMSSDMFQGAAVKGASKALDRVAQFYIDMAEGIFPVIEVDAGRQVDVIMNRGVKLQIRGTAK